MKGFMIYETPLWGDEKNAVYTQEVKDASYTLKQVGGDDNITCYLEGIATKDPVTKATCNAKDTYDFETGALISLMKMCGVDKVVRACNEAFSEETFKTYATKYERELNDLSKKYDKVVKYCESLREANKKSQEEKEQIIVAKSILNNKLIEENSKLSYIKSCNESTIETLENTRDLLINKNNELIEENKKLKSDKDKSWKNYQREIKKLEAENEKLKLDCIKLQHGYVDTDNVPSGYWDGDILDIFFLPGRACGKQYKALVEMFKKLDKKKVQEAYKEAYGDRVIWCTSQPEVHPLSTAVLEGVSYLNKKFKTYSIEEWLYKIPTRREKKWERILALHKENDVIIEVKKEDVKTFLHEIEDKIPEITWASDVKIFEAKGTIKDIYEELITHNRIYFRLSKKNKLSYSSDLNAYLFKNLDMISYLPPMRWDLFKKGRLAVKVSYNNYKEFYEACEKELGKRPVTAVLTEDFTVSICKKDGLFEIFTIEDQKETGRKIVDWEDVR